MEADMTTKNNGMRILVVDDNEATAKTFGWMLEMLGHEVQLAYDGASAIEKAKDFMPQVAILDISLPGMNGYELCQHLRAQPGLEGTVFAAQTGWDQPEHKERSRAAGFHHHLVKPVTLQRLEAMLSTTMVTKVA